MMNIWDIIGIVFGAGGFASAVLGAILFYRANRRTANAKADTLEITNELTEVDRLEARLKQRDDKIDAIYIDYRKLQTEHIELLKKYNALELRNQEAEIKKCHTRACTNRIPPSEY